MDVQQNNKRKLICVFDSGIGGLNLLKACADKIPWADFAYFADNYRVPYGNLSDELILRYTSEAFDKIAALNPDAALVACNTVTAKCIGDLRARFKFPIAGIQPAVKQAARLGGNFLVLATNSTTRSPSFKKLISLYGKQAEVYACPHLAALIEQNIFDLTKTDFISALPQGNYSSLVLGCTHYIFISDLLKKHYKIPVFDGMAGTADHLLKISGICDHQATYKQKFTFFGGDITKNRTVFESFCQKNV